LCPGQAPVPALVPEWTQTIHVPGNHRGFAPTFKSSYDLD